MQPEGKMLHESLLEKYVSINHAHPNRDIDERMLRSALCQSGFNLRTRTSKTLETLKWDCFSLRRKLSFALKAF